MNAQMTKQTIVIQMLCVQTPKDRMSVVVSKATKAMGKRVQIKMSVQVIILMTVTLTLCVPTLMDLMCVAVLEAMREMAKTVQLQQLPVHHLVAQMHFVKTMVDLLNVYATMDIKETDIVAQISTNAKITMQMDAILTLGVPTL